MKRIYKVMTALLIVLSQAFGITYYVDGSIGTSGDGLSWETAFKTVEEGISIENTTNDK